MQARYKPTALDPKPHRVDADLDRITEFARKSLRADDVAVIPALDSQALSDCSAFVRRLAKLVVEGDSVIAVPDLIFDQNALKGPIYGFLGVPIHGTNGQPIAALCVMTHQTRIWSRSDRETLRFLGGEVEEMTRMREAVAVEARRAAQHRLVAREYHHRIRNAFSVSSAVVVLTGAQCPSVQSLVETTSGQLAALANAHTAITFEEEVADLADLVQGALQAYSFAEAAVDISGPEVEIDEQNVISISLILNELATNSTKHGAFRLGGTLRVTWTIKDGQVILRWSERSSHLTMTRTERVGSFGGAMMEMSVAQLSAKLERTWLPDGLDVELTFPL